MNIDANILNKRIINGIQTYALKCHIMLTIINTKNGTILIFFKRTN